MTYQNKKVKKHKRGNWYARLRFNDKMICFTAEEAEKLAKGLQRIEAIVVQNIPIEPQPLQAITLTQVKAKNTYTLKEWYDEWIASYKTGSVRPATLRGFKDIRLAGFGQSLPSLSFNHC